MAVWCCIVYRKGYNRFLNFIEAISSVIKKRHILVQKCVLSNDKLSNLNTIKVLIYVFRTTRVGKQWETKWRLGEWYPLCTNVAWNFTLSCPYSELKCVCRGYFTEICSTNYR